MSECNDCCFTANVKCDQDDIVINTRLKNGVYKVKLLSKHGNVFFNNYQITDGILTLLKSNYPNGIFAENSDVFITIFDENDVQQFIPLMQSYSCININMKPNETKEVGLKLSL